MSMRFVPIRKFVVGILVFSTNSLYSILESKRFTSKSPRITGFCALLIFAAILLETSLKVSSSLIQS